MLVHYRAETQAIHALRGHTHYAHNKEDFTLSQYGDEAATVYETRSRKAKKEHQCSACFETILVGQTYEYVFIIYDGNNYIYKRCPRCQMIYLHLHDRISKERECQEEFCDEQLDCGHEYEERWGEPPPEWLAALAFWIPGDPIPSRATT